MWGAASESDGTPNQNNGLLCPLNTERFLLGPRERMFYDRISEYLREGYDAAGIGEARTTRKQRAIGFVMAIFQKIMS